MIQKSTQGKTNKYSGLVKNVKENEQKPEEPRITAGQVIEAFQSFGFQPNDRNHNDIAYWTTKGNSELPKLMEELHKRRMDINNKEDDEEKAESDKKKAAESKLNEENESKATLPRLSDEEIAAMFDEYGLPVPDPEWARTHLPNDPKKIRAILEMQRKTADDMLKKHSKNAVNAVPETPKNTPMMGGMGGYSGQGGPGPTTPMGMQGEMTGEEPKTPFFIGDHALVRISNPTNSAASTIWLVDTKKKVLRPFMSEKAFENAFEDPEEAQKSVISISPRELGKGGSLEGFTPLQANKGVKDDGSMDTIEFSPAELQNRYGKPEDPAGENKALSMLDGIFGKIGQDQTQQPEQPLPPQ